MLLLKNIDRFSVYRLLDCYELKLELLAPDQVITGSFWGEREAGLLRSRLYARLDTPLHSVLHETAHYVCMTPERRASLDTDAKGDDAEEAAVCYLQILLGAEIPGTTREIMFSDMDEWGYSFRLGTTAAWFTGDAGDSRLWLRRKRIIDDEQRVTFRCRET